MERKNMKKARSKSKTAPFKDEAKNWVINKFKEVAEAMKFGILDMHFIFQMQDENPKVSSAIAGHTALLMVNPVIEYKRAEIFISPLALRMTKTPQERTQLVDAIVHELCHVHIAPLSNIAERRYSSEQELREAVETVTETMATFVRLLLKNKDKIYKV